MSLIRAALAVAVLLVAGARPAAADAPKVACALGAEEGQRLRAQGKLREAREAFTACAAERCPPLIRSDCSGWLAEVELAVPTVVIRASAGEDQTRELFDVEVRVDGVLLTNRLDGRALAVNPGEHHFSFSAPDRATIEDDIVIRVGEKHRLLTVTLTSLRPVPAPAVARPAPAAPPPRVGTAAKVLLVGGGAALVSAAAFGTSGWLEARSLRRRCAPGCPADDVDSVRLRLRIADVSLAVGAVALATAGILVWARPGPEGGEATVGVAPLAGGALVAVRFGSR